VAETTLTLAGSEAVARIEFGSLEASASTGIQRALLDEL
jgi:hypothetical protein